MNQDTVRRSELVKILKLEVLARLSLAGRGVEELRREVATNRNDSIRNRNQVKHMLAESTLTLTLTLGQADARRAHRESEQRQKAQR